MESAEVVRFLMRIEAPTPGVIAAIQGAVRWLSRSRLRGIRVEEISAPETKFEYHASATDRRVVADPGAPPIWARFYELGTNRPLFCNRDGIPVYSLAEVERERRTGYAWYTADPARVLREYASWRRSHRVREDALAP
jgi:PelA/Pel-15E family pectate lyase